MSRRKGNVRAFITIFLLASILLLYSMPRHTWAQEEEQQQPQPPLKRMRRVRGQPPRPLPPAATTQSSSEDDVVRVDTDLANILLTAVDKDQRFITTLRKEDVRVLEDNRPQEISNFERETDLPLTLAILVDTSGSEVNQLPDEKRAAQVFIDSIIKPDRDKVALVSFTGEAVLQEELTNDLGKLRAAVNRLTIQIVPGDPRCAENVFQREPNCLTGVWDAIWVSINEVLSQTPEHSRRALILLSDGEDSSSATKRQEAIDFAVQNNVVIYSIGIGDPDKYGIDEGALRKVSEKTGGRVFFPANKAELDAAFAQIQQELRSQYLVSYTPANRSRDGSYRHIKIEITDPELRKQKLRLLYRQGYYARTAPPAAAPAPKGGRQQK